MSTIYEKYRPRVFADIIGQPGLVADLERMQAGGDFTGEAFWISGLTGTGKTSIARIIADLVAAPHYQYEVDAKSLNVAELRQWKYDCHYGAPSPGGRCYIINEAHGLRVDCITNLLDTLEYPRWQEVNTVIFTTTSEGQLDFCEGQMDGRAFLSRSVPIKLTEQGLAQSFAAAVQAIAEREGLGGRPASDYLKLARDRRNNFRAMLQAVKRGAMRGEAVAV